MEQNMKLDSVMESPELSKIVDKLSATLKTTTDALKTTTDASKTLGEAQDILIKRTNLHTEQIRIMAGVQKHKSKQVNDLSVRLNQLEKQIEVLGGTILPSSD